MSDYLLRGIPRSILQDAWWLSVPDDLPPTGDIPCIPNEKALAGPGPRHVGIALFGLILLADWLFFDHPVGLSLAAFASVLAVVCLAVSRHAADAQQWLCRLGLLALTVLPVIEEVQALSLGVLGVGLSLMAVQLIVGWAGSATKVLTVLTRFWGQLPFAALRDARRKLVEIRADAGAARTASSLWRAWAMPVVVGLGFTALLLGANPVMSHWAEALSTIGFDPETLARRLTFWGFVAILVWPFLVAAQMADRLLRPFAPTKSGRPGGFATPAIGINPASIANALGLFNLIFAVQTTLDLTYLWGGAVLPNGMTHATYAHRGAYPLVATALLAGIFALISRPYTNGRPVLRALLMIWIGQNVLLVLSALYRLDLYVGEFGWTYLRVRAAIWMGMVAVGLALTVWQVWRGKSNLWLLHRNCVMLGCVLYLSAFVNFADVIARQNLGRADTWVAMDADYLCRLGPNAAAAITDYDRKIGSTLCQPVDGFERPNIIGWRDWGFRKWRVLRAISAPIVPAKAGSALDGGRI
jgi:hypothetical protein